VDDDDGPAIAPNVGTEVAEVVVVTLEEAALPPPDEKIVSF
jgi:hypothetical protein